MKNGFRRWGGPSFACVALFIFCLPHAVRAAGYGTREFSTVSMGQAYAGSAAHDGDPSFLGFNPAALGGVGDWDVAVGATGVWAPSDAHYDTAETAAAVPISGARDQSDFIDDGYVPNLSVRYRLSGEWSAGLSITAPWGLSTSYDPDWAGRYHAVDTKLMTVNVAPAIAYQPTPDLTLALAAQIQYAKGKLSSAIDIGSIGAFFGVPGALPASQDGFGEYNAEDWGFGFTLGALWRPADDVRIGVSYRSEIAHRMEGLVDFTLDTAGVGAALQGGAGILADSHAYADLTTPQAVELGIAIDVEPGVTVSAELGWMDWSVFDDLTVVFDNTAQPDEITRFGWKDAWFAALGVEWKASEAWTLRMGTAYDQSPARDETRNARIVDADRIWLAVGADIALSDNAQLSLALAHVFLPEGEVTLSAADPANVFRGNLAGATDADATGLSLALTWR